MTHSEYVYVRFFSDYPVDRLQIGEEFLELKKHLIFSLGEKYEKTCVILKLNGGFEVLRALVERVLSSGIKRCAVH
jgi:hypothetical protein